MDWVLIVLYMSDDRELQFMSTAERLRFKSGVECNEHYHKYKSDIDGSIHRNIASSLPLAEGYTIQHIGCMNWGIKNNEGKSNE